MIHSGLVSVTFRKLKPQDIVDLVQKAGLDGIEWGGDIHVPHGDIAAAVEVSKITEAAGLRVAAYGSYFKLGCTGPGFPAFEQVLETALALKTKVIRVWAGNRGSLAADEEWWEKVIEESGTIASMAASAGVAVSYEYHGNTLTDHAESALKLLESVKHENMKSYWQPRNKLSVDSNLDELNKMKKWLTNIHVFHVSDGQKLPLEAGREVWLQYLNAVKQLDGDHFAMLEFVKDESEEQFLQDAEVLKQIVSQSER